MSNLTVGKFRNNVLSGMYCRKQLVNMLHTLDSLTQPLNNQNIQKRLIIKQTLSGEDTMTREEMILKGLIKPAETQSRPTLTLNKPEEVEDVILASDKEITDADVAQKYLSLRSSANRRGKEFNLTLSDVRTLLKKKTCYYTGLKFTDEVNYQRTVDRVDNTKGYVKGNVVACTHIANQLKEMLVENKEAPFRTNVKALKKFIDKL